MRRGQCPFGRRDQRVDPLPLATLMQAKAGHHLEIALCPAQQRAIGPDPPDPRNAPRREQHGKGRRVAIDVGARLPLAVAAAGAAFDEVGGPDYRARHAHRPKNPGDLASVRGSLHRQVGKPRALAIGAFQQLAVDCLPRNRANRAANRPAKHRAHHAQQQSRH